ncbi:aminoglycoside phosphotransferase family protein [Methanoculleus sp. Wushi-C6]|uniref:Aminoglycoside phosphotransferase family protein n=1 Tax=Methanoculleus caldifontis TaxID=2651577 RepID=A0ABU3WYE9_9EURY|nr:phosphotransferase [Methanoculleus sp. Wushi-C6]MDV2480751.1 aminoglycoside phosphotransferase family protein [Methanoculleus sp. Wushi-C6]
MVRAGEVGLIEPGDPFGDWLASVVGDGGPVRVCRIEPASHVVCRYEFDGTGTRVIGKFFGAPTGAKTDYDAEKALANEVRRLNDAAGLIRVPRVLAAEERFGAVLVTECVPGPTLREVIGTGAPPYEPLTGVARLLRRLHDGTGTSWHRERDFAYFRAVLDQNGLPARERERFDRLIEEWRQSPRLSGDAGCTVHGDATPGNYLCDGEVCAIDFEAGRDHAHPIRDLGILAAEMKASPGSSRRAEDWIGHLLWHYSGDEAEFRESTAVLPFFMALGHLRIARLPWRAAERDWLLEEAEACLSAVRR